MTKKHVIHSLIMLIIVLFVFVGMKMDVLAKRDIVIVIDPGHGGSNMGAEYNGVTEKEATLKVAAAMKAELEKYEGVVVYVTRTSDEDMELAERAAFAGSVKADLFLSLHFNMSENHDLHGSEMWISSQESLKTEAQRFADIELKLLEEYGIEKRGCFTRLNDEGTDYYGVIRESAKYGIPAVIVEHCYLDRVEEEKFYETDDALERLGRIDATAVAMSYGLSSEKLGVDYTGHRVYNTELPDYIYDADTTPPSEVAIDIVYFDRTNFELTLNIKVKDDESSVVYYEYSFNNGKTFRNREQVGIRDDFDVNLFAYGMNDNDLIIRAYNAYGLYTDSNCLKLNELLFGHYETFPEDMPELTLVANPEDSNISLFIKEMSPEARQASFFVIILGVILGILTLFMLILHNYSGKIKSTNSIKKSQKSA